MKTNLKIFIVLGMISFSCSSPPEKTNNDPDIQQLTEFSLEGNAHIETGIMEKKIISGTISCTGNIELPPQFQYSVHSKLNGYVKYVRYIEGDRVRKGDHIFSIENIALIPKQRELLELKAKLTYANQVYERKSELIQSNATSKAEFDMALAELNLLKASYAGLKAELQLAGVKIKELENEEKFQSLFPIFATANGHVSHIFTHMGMFIELGIPLMEIVDRSHPHLELSIFNRDAIHIKKDQEVHFNIPGRIENFTAKIERINPALDEENGTLNVHCHIDNIPDFEILKLGTFVNATIVIPGREVVCIPEEAVIKEAEQFYIFQIEDGEPVKTLVKTGERTDGLIELLYVSEELKNAEVVLKGAYYIQ